MTIDNQIRECGTSGSMRTSAIPFHSIVTVARPFPTVRSTHKFRLNLAKLEISFLRPSQIKRCV